MALHSSMESFFGNNDVLLSSTVPLLTTSMCSSDLWPVDECQFYMPTPPVSPSHNDLDQIAKIEPLSPSSPTSSYPSSPCSTSAIPADLDLGMSEYIGYELPNVILDDDPCTWFNDGFPTENDANELRHDCMWSGVCPAEEHSKKPSVQPPELSCSPPEASILSMAANTLPCVSPGISCRNRLDTFNSTRPETPLSLSDSELDADQVTSDEGNNKGNRSSSSSSSSSSADESESDEERFIYPPTLPANIQPVRNNQTRKFMSNNKSMIKMTVSSCSSLIPDHSYSHSDHSYHTQRRPINNDLMATPFDLGAPTPSDSGEFVSLF